MAGGIPAYYVSSVSRSASSPVIDPVEPDFENTPASPGRPRYGYAPENVLAAPRVSIITPFYNTGEVFGETVLSILGQSFQQWEWLIVNDGSSDASALELLDRFRRLDSRIRVIDHDDNRGLSAARNTGFRAAAAPYVVYVDSDDLLEPTAVEKCLWYLETHPRHAFAKGYSVGFGGMQYLSPRGFEEGTAFLQHNVVNATAMIRRHVIEQLGGFDSGLRTGLEDWDFWLRAAGVGSWGGTVPEYLDWYRRRPSHSDRWSSWNPAGITRFRQLARERYPHLWEKNGFPSIDEEPAVPFCTPDVHVPFENRLFKRRPRTLFIVPWMEIGGADRVNLDWVAGLIEHGHEVTICATLQAQNRWAPQFNALTPDVFILPHFLGLRDVPRFLAYLIRSRQIDTVFINNSTLGYQLLPYLRSRCPDAAYIDINHAEEPHWLNGGHPRFGVGYQEVLDLNITSTAYLRDWMAARGADPERVTVCHTGAAASLLAADASSRMAGDDGRTEADNLLHIVFSGRLCAQKRPLLAVEILHRLRMRGLQFDCSFIGDGELRPAVEKAIHRYGLKNSVTVVGAVGHETCLGYFSASDVLLLPSAYEGISVALYEAMATGLVVVAAKVGGHEEVLSTDEGFLIPHGAGEVDRYVEVLSRLAADRGLLRDMKQAARRQIARNFTTEHGIRKLLAAIDQAHMLSKTSPRQVLSPGFAIETATLAIEYARLTTYATASPRLSRLLAGLRRHKLGKSVVDNWLTKAVVKKFGHTTLLRKLRNR